MRMSRRMGLVKGIVLPSLYEFWSDASVVTCLGKSSTTPQEEFLNIAIGDTSTPLWLMVSKGDFMQFFKCANSTIANRKNYFDPDYSSTITADISDGSTNAATKIDLYTTYVGDKLYGYVLAGLRFPSFPETVVDWMLFNKIHVEFLENAYNYDSNPSSVYIADADLSSDPNDVYLQFACTTSTGYISATRGGTPGTAIMTSGSRAYWRHSSSRYYFSTGGSSNSTTRAGGLYRLHI